MKVPTAVRHSTLPESSARLDKSRARWLNTQIAGRGVDRRSVNGTLQSLQEHYRMSISSHQLVQGSLHILPASAPPHPPAINLLSEMTYYVSNGKLNSLLNATRSTAAEIARVGGHHTV